MLDPTQTLSSSMADRRTRLILEKYPELADPDVLDKGYNSMMAAPELSPLGAFLAKEHGPLGLRLGDFTPASYGLAMRDVQQLGAEAEAARRQGNTFEEYTNRALQGVAGLGAIPMLGAVINPVAKVAKKGGRKISDLVAGFGEKWGPREGFYSKAERVLDQKMQGPMRVDEAIKLLRGQGVKETEIRNLDLQRLARELGDRRATPQELGEWIKARRPNYREEVRAGEGSKAELPYDEDQLRNDAEQQFRDSEAEYVSERVREDTDWETVENEDGEILGNRIMRQGEALDAEDLGFYTVEGDTTLVDPAEYSQERFERQFRRSLDTLAEQEFDDAVRDFDPDEWITDNYGDMETYARHIGAFDEDWTPGSEGSVAAEVGLDVEAEAKWPSWTVRANAGQLGEEEMKNYTELIQQVAPTGQTLRRALNKEMTALDDQKIGLINEFGGNEQLARETAPDKFKAIDDAIAMRQRLYDETDRAESKTYSTHWGNTPDPLQHVRMLYNQDEAATIPRTRIQRPEDALFAGYSYEVKPATSTSSLPEITVTDPEGYVIRQQQLSAPPFSVDPYRANQMLEESALTRMMEAAKRNETTNMPPTPGRAGLYAQELQADVEQQSKRNYRPAFWESAPDSPERRAEMAAMVQKEYPGAREYQRITTDPDEAMARRFGERQPGLFEGEGYEAIEPAERYASSTDGRYASFSPVTQSGRTMPRVDRYPGRLFQGHQAVRASYDRMVGSPEFQDYVQSLPRAEREKVYNRMDEWEQQWGSAYEEPETTLDLLAVAEKAGVPAANRMVTPTLRREPAVGVPMQDYRTSLSELQNQAARDAYQAGESNVTPDMFYSSTPGTYWDNPQLLGIGTVDEFGIPEELTTDVARWWNPPPSNELSMVRPGDMESVAKSLNRQAWPEYPLGDDRYNLGTKRALLEAAATGQDFLAWPYADTQLNMNRGRSPKLFPALYGLQAGGPGGYVAENVRKAAGLKAQPMALAHGDLPALESWNLSEILQNNPNFNQSLGEMYRGKTHPVKGVYLDEKTRKKILDEGLPFYMIPPAFAGLLGFLGTGEEPQYD